MTRSQMRDVERRLIDTPAGEPPEGLLERLRADVPERLELAAEPPRRRAPFPPRWLAAAAVVVLTLGGGWLLWRLSGAVLAPERGGSEGAEAPAAVVTEAAAEPARLTDGLEGAGERGADGTGVSAAPTATGASRADTGTAAGAAGSDRAVDIVVDVVAETGAERLQTADPADEAHAEARGLTPIASPAAPRAAGQRSAHDALAQRLEPARARPPAAVPAYARLDSALEVAVERGDLRLRGIELTLLAPDGTIRQAVTGREGTARFGDLVPGVYQVLAQGEPGSAPGMLVVEIAGTGRARTPAVIELDGGRAVRLTVRDELGAPLPGAVVEVAPGTVSPRVTGAEGSADLALPPGRYRLDVSLPGFLGRGMIVEVPSSGASVQVELALAYVEFAEQIAVVGKAVKIESSATSAAASDTRRRARPQRRPAPPPPSHAAVAAAPAPPPQVTPPPAARQRIVPSPRDEEGAPGKAAPAPYANMNFRDYGVHPFVATSEDRLSTFGLDVDTGSWGLVQGYLRRGHLPPAAAVRVEEVVNALGYGDPAPARGETFRITAEGAPTPFSPGPDHRLLRFGLRARSIDLRDRRPATLTFVVDVSGSMAEGGRLELVQEALGLLLDQLGDGDRVAVVAFSDEARVVLAPTGDPRAARRAIATLAAQGSTNAEAGLALGYRLAWQEKRPGAANRVLLLSDGVANVGGTDAESLLARVAGAAADGIELTTVGVGMGNYDDVLLEQLANRGDGRYAYVDDVAAARRLFVEELAGTLETVAEEARVQVEFDPQVVASWRLLGYENRHLEDHRFRHDHTVDGGEIGAGHTVTALYEVRLAGDPPPAAGLAHLKLRFRDPEGGRFTETGRTLRVADLSPTWEEAPRSLRLAAVAAELAEQLRGSEHAASADPTDLARRARAAAADFPGDERAAELADLAARAAGLAARP